MDIECVACDGVVQAELTNGADVYPHREDLADLPFWKCPTCNNYVGCHHKTQDRTRPLGIIPSPELREARRTIHKVIDPMWKKRHIPRDAVYARLTKVLGREYHTADLRNLDEARRVYVEARKMSKTIDWKGRYA